MTFIDTLSGAWPAIDSRPIGQIEQEIVDELEFHVEMRTRENVLQGMSHDAARNAALTRFGNVAKIQQKCRHTLLGERIMWQRIQMALSIVLLAAVALLAAQLYSGQRANQAALADITASLKQLVQPPTSSIAPFAAAPSIGATPNNWSADRPFVAETVPKCGNSAVDPCSPKFA